MCTPTISNRLTMEPMALPIQKFGIVHSTNDNGITNCSCNILITDRTLRCTYITPYENSPENWIIIVRNDMVHRALTDKHVLCTTIIPSQAMLPPLLPAVTTHTAPYVPIRHVTRSPLEPLRIQPASHWPSVTNVPVVLVNTNHHQQPQQPVVDKPPSVHMSPLRAFPMFAPIRASPRKNALMVIIVGPYTSVAKVVDADRYLKQHQLSCSSNDHPAPTHRKWHGIDGQPIIGGDMLRPHMTADLFQQSHAPTHTPTHRTLYARFDEFRTAGFWSILVKSTTVAEPSRFPVGTFTTAHHLIKDVCSTLRNSALALQVNSNDIDYTDTTRFKLEAYKLDTDAIVAIVTLPALDNIDVVPRYDRLSPKTTRIDMLWTDQPMDRVMLS